MYAMKTLTAIIGTSILAILVPTATAEKCAGVDSIYRESPIDIKTIEDGSKWGYGWDRRIRIVKEPVGHPADGAHGNCMAIYKVDADGETFSGYGNCYYVDLDGDSWSDFGRFNTATQQHSYEFQFGTGKYQNYAESGTKEFSFSTAYGDGMRFMRWEGECSEIN